jgi:hypothetical protein
MATDIGIEIKQLDAAREPRLSIGSQSNFDCTGKRAILCLPTLVPNIIVGTMHRANRQTAITMITLWSICTTLVFSMNSLHIHPYKGVGALRPTPTQRS